MNHPTEKPTHRDLGTDLPAVTEDQRHIGVAIPREGISGNYCRCTGYHAIVDAVCAVLEQQRAGRFDEVRA